MLNLYCEKIETPLGVLIAVADNKNLLALQFENQFYSNKNFRCCNLINKSCEIIYMLRNEMNLYFSGKSEEFKTPLNPKGTDFQCMVWKELRNIPYGETRSYSDIALKIGFPKSWRVTANANAHNEILILIPCHRVIRKSGELCGYNAGMDKKKWLIDFEKRLNK